MADHPAGGLGNPAAASSPARALPPLAAGLIAFAAALARGGALFADPDPYLHIAAGRWMIAHFAVPDRDPFSYTMAGAPWLPHEWLSELVIAGLYGGLGWSGLALGAALAFAAAIALLVHSLQRYVGVAYALLGGLTAGALCFPHLLARPHLLVLPILVGWTAALVAARAAGRAPHPVLALALVLWANLHGSYMFGLGLALLFAAEALFDAPDRSAALIQARLWARFLVGALGAAFVTPNGLAGVTFPFALLRMDFALSWVDEWRSPDFHQGEPLESWLLLALLGILLAGIRLPVTRILLVLLLLHLALLHQRHAELLGLLAPLLAAPALAPQLARLPVPARLASRGVWAALALAVAACVWRLPSAEPAGRFTPAAALAAARAHGIAGPVFNDFDSGAYLIFAGVAPFVDSRFDLYGDAFLRRYRDLAQLSALLEQYRVTWTLLAPDSARAVLMDHLPGWSRLYGDASAVVHVRTGSTPSR